MGALFSLPVVLGVQIPIFLYFSSPISIATLHLYSLLLPQQNSIKQKPNLSLLYKKNKNITIIVATGKYGEIETFYQVTVITRQRILKWPWC